MQHPQPRFLTTVPVGAPEKRDEKAAGGTLGRALWLQGRESVLGRSKPATGRKQGEQEALKAEGPQPAQQPQWGGMPNTGSAPPLPQAPQGNRTGLWEEVLPIWVLWDVEHSYFLCTPQHPAQGQAVVNTQ